MRREAKMLGREVVARGWRRSGVPDRACASCGRDMLAMSAFAALLCGTHGSYAEVTADCSPALFCEDCHWDRVNGDRSIGLRAALRLTRERG